MIPKDQRSQSAERNMTSQPFSEAAQKGSVIPKDQAAVGVIPKDHEKIPWIRVRIRPKYGAAREIVEGWKAEKSAAENIYNAVLFYDAYKHGDVDAMREICPALPMYADQPSRSKKNIKCAPLDPSHTGSFDTDQVDSEREKRIQEIATALSDVTGFDPVINEKKIRRSAEKIERGGLGGRDVYTWYECVWLKNFPASKTGESPDLTKVEEGIGRVRKLKQAEPQPKAKTIRLDEDDELTAEVVGESVRAAPEQPQASELVVVPGDKSLDLGGDVEYALFAYAIEAATGADLKLNPAAQNDIREMFGEGYRAEDVAYFLQEVWPADWRSRDTDSKGRPRRPEKPTVDLIKQGIGHVKHHLEKSKYDNPGDELIHRVNAIRKRIQTGDPITDLRELQSADWDHLGNKYERAVTFAQQAWRQEDAEYEEYQPREELGTEDHPELRRAIESWTFIVKPSYELRMAVGSSKEQYMYYIAPLKLVWIDTSGPVHRFVFSAPHKYAKENFERRLAESIRREIAAHYLWQSPSMDKPLAEGISVEIYDDDARQAAWQNYEDVSEWGLHGQP